jgi:hypothetical protein
VVFQPILLPLFRVIGQQIDTYVKKVEKLGKIERKELGKNVSEACVG